MNVQQLSDSPSQVWYPLSANQRSLWLLYRMQPALRGRYYVRFAARLEPSLEPERLRAALNVLAARHAMLRTSIAEIDGQVLQSASSRVDVPVLLFEVDDLDEAVLVDRVERDSMEPFDESVAPLMRAILYRAGTRECVLSLVIDHLVCDAWSMWQLVDELAGWFRDPESPKVARQLAPPEFFGFVMAQRHWLRGAQARRQLEYWRGVLAEPKAPLELAYNHCALETRNTLTRMFDAELTAALKALGKYHGASLFVTLLAANFILLHRLTGQTQLAVGSPMPARTSEWSDTVGTFSNPVVLCAEIASDLDVAGLLRQLRTTVWGALKNQAYPLAKLVEQLAPERGTQGQPYFQTLFVFQKARVAEDTLGVITRTHESAKVRWGDLALSPFGRWQSGGGVGMDLLFETAEVRDRLYAGIEYHEGKFERATIERYLGYWERVLRAMVADAGQLVGAVPLLSLPEQQKLMQWGAARCEFADERCLHELFEQQVQRTPQSVAVQFGTQCLSYKEVNRRANRLAHYLREQGIGPDVRVALCLERSCDMVVAVLAVLKSGGGYVPLDPAYPQERLAFLLADCSPCLLIVDSQGRSALGPRVDQLPSIDVQDDEDWSDRPESDLNASAIGLTARHLAYVIYTSGSTGTPKGVMVEHAHVTRLFLATSSSFRFQSSDTWSLFHSYSFDFSVWEIWGALLHGGRLVVVPLATARAPQEFYEFMCDHGITVLNQTPSAFRQLIEAQRTSSATHCLRYVIFGGEALEEPALKPWYAQPRNKAVQLINMYGITETTVHATYRLLGPSDPQQRSGSIGTPLQDLRIYILDAYGAPAPTEVRGEIYVGGAGVARGYLNRNELTAQRFLPDPFCRVAGARMYRSGDLGRWRADGSIQYLGRNDEQVKVRGFRIELGEIEMQLRNHPQVREVVVLAQEDVTAEKRLVAYIVGANCNLDELQAHASKHLPHYMVPAAYVKLLTLPLTPNGKLDRDALPPPFVNAEPLLEHAAPQGEVERALAAVWAQLLQLPYVGRHDNFFRLGGHSFLAVRMVKRLREYDLELDVLSVFASPTLSALAQFVQHTPADKSGALKVPGNLIPEDCTQITPQMLPLVDLSQEEIDAIVVTVDGGACNVQDIYPLTSAQEGILFHHLSQQQGDAYLLPSLLRFESRQGLDEFVSSLRASIARHDILRTAFLWEGLTRPVQVVWRRTELEVTTIDVDSSAGSAAEQLRARFAPHRYRLDVTRAPLLQVCMAHDFNTQSWLLMVVTHHLIQDNVALQALLEEMRIRVQGGALPEAVPYRSYVAQLRLGVDAQAHQAFFRDMLGTVEEPSLPFGLHAERAAADPPQRARVVLAEQLSRGLRTQARAWSVSVASLFHLAWARLVACAASREQAVFGTVLFGRMQAGAGSSRASGMFTNTLPICIAADAGEVRTRLLDTHRQLALLLQHENASLVLAQRCSGVPPSTPLFTSLLNYRHGFVSNRGELGWPGIELLDSEEGSHYPLRLSVDDVETGFTLTVHAPADVGAQRVCELVTTTLQSLVAALEHAPHTPVNELEVLSAAERQQVLCDWNEPVCISADNRCVHELFELQAARTPAAVALEHGQQQMTYAELDQRANQLARCLLGFGVGPEQRVALCMERSMELVVGVLAILKAGGAYVPLEPSYPAARLAYILQDAAPRLVLTQHALRGLLPATEAAVFEVDARWEEIAIFDTAQLPSVVEVTPSLLACVTYTSGSTGQPKGVMADHARTVNRLVAQAGIAPLGTGEVCALKTAIGFVDAIFEMLHPLLAGAKLVIIENALTADLRQLATTLDARHVTRWITVPSLAAALLRDERCVQQLQGLRYWLLSGEALSPGLLKQLQQQLPACTFINIYGASEAADATYYIGGSLADEARVPIGRPLAHTQIYVLDAKGAPVPIGVVGEIYVAGAALARGYLNLPELTEQRFHADPFVVQPGRRMYRTGDLGRWRSEGMLEYLGRNDHQVKIRGFRIEPAEIEACLREHEQVREVVVVVRDAAAQGYLVAYYVSDASVGVESLRSHVAAALPNYMVPAAYVRLVQMPLTPNGKLDRRALPAPEGDAYAHGSYDAPQGEMEIRLAQLWTQLLKVERIGRHDNFFELGGHSLLAVSLSQLIAVQLQVELSIADVFAHPELTQMAARLTDAMLGQFDADELLALTDT